MGKKRASKDAIPHWFRSVFGPGIEDGYVELRVFPNDRGPIVAREWVQDAQSFSDFVASYDEKDQGVAIYYGPYVRSRKGGTKNDLAYTRMLWAEIDTDKLEWDSNAVAKYLHALPDELRPSACIHSGHGLHLYWYLDETVSWEQRGGAVEGTNRLLRDMVSGDNVWNADRVMRVPWTWNTKAKPVQSRVIWNYHWHKRSLRDIHDAVADADMVLDHDGFVTRKEWERRDAERYQQNTDPTNAYTVAHADRRKTIGARGNAIWTKCTYGGGPGRVGIDEAITQYTAWAYCRLAKPTPEKLQAIVDDTLSRVRKIKERDAPNEQWDWAAERREIASKLSRWVRKWNEIREEG